MKVYCQNEKCVFNCKRFKVNRNGGPQSNRSCAKAKGNVHLDENGVCLDKREGLVASG